MDLLAVLLLLFVTNLRHFHLVTTLCWSLQTIWWWLHSAGCRCCCVLWDLPNSVMPDAIECFLEVAEVMMELLWVFQIFLHQHCQVGCLISACYSCVIWNWLVPLPRSLWCVWLQFQHKKSLNTEPISPSMIHDSVHSSSTSSSSSLLPPSSPAAVFGSLQQRKSPQPTSKKPFEEVPPSVAFLY